MEDITQSIQTIIVAGILCSFILYAIVEKFYRGKKEQILISKKYKTKYQGFNSTRSKITSVNHYIIECKIIDSGKYRTLKCSSDIYNSLKENKKAVVIIKMGQIIKILPPK